MSNEANDRLIIRGAREHNLKDVSLDLPRNSLIVFTGLLAFVVRWIALVS